MTLTARRFFADVDRQVLESLPSGVSVVFHLSGPQGGSWTVQRTDQGDSHVALGAIDRPDCIVRCSCDDFRSLVEGELDPRDGFMSGRLEVEGDVGLVLCLHRGLRR